MMPYAKMDISVKETRVKNFTHRLGSIIKINLVGSLS